MGIDSIKRVEILSAVQEKAPELPEVDGSQMAQLQTLGEIVGGLQGDSRDFSQAEASEVGVSAIHTSVEQASVISATEESSEELSGSTDGVLSSAISDSDTIVTIHEVSEESSVSSSNEEEGDFSESEREVTDVVPQFETLWTPLRNGLSIVGLSVQNQSRRWDCSTLHWNQQPSLYWEMKI